MIPIQKKPEPKRGVCFRLTQEMIRELDRIAKQQEVDRTAVIEAALAYFLKQYKK